MARYYIETINEFKFIYIMSSENKHEKRGNRTSPWLVVGVIVLIVLLIVWLSIADLWGDTDVAAAVMPRLAFLAPLII